MAFREGNVIDLGPVQLQVVEACSGIRYLLPLTSLALLCAYLFKDRMWKRVVLVLSSIPISIMLNGFRIGMIGVLVELYGKGAAEGFYHLFEGWVIFMVSFGLLIAEMMLLAKIGEVKEESVFDRLTWRDRSGESAHQAVPKVPCQIQSASGRRYLCSIALLAPFTLFSTVVVDREESPPPRAAFLDFPMQIDRLARSAFPLDQQYIDALRFDDYVLADYRSKGTTGEFLRRVLSITTEGAVGHSPQSCCRVGDGDRVPDAKGTPDVAGHDAVAKSQSGGDSEGGSEANNLVLV